MSDRDGYLKRRDQLLAQDERIADLEQQLAALTDDLDAQLAQAMSVVKDREQQLSTLREAAQDVTENIKPNYSTAKNDSSVRKGYCVGGSIRYYEVPPHKIHILQNTLAELKEHSNGG